MKSDGLHDDKPLPERLRERAAEADQMAANLNNGVRKWRMCVPVQHDDTDMIVARLITSAREAADELERLTARSERERIDPGTEKMLRDLLDRAYKMMMMSGYRVQEHDPNHNDPITAWMSDARSVLYGGTKPEPDLARLK